MLVAPAFPSNIRLCWKGLPRLNTILYRAFVTAISSYLAMIGKNLWSQEEMMINGNKTSMTKLFKHLVLTQYSQNHTKPAT
jgi:hypothetical protein